MFEKAVKLHQQGELQRAKKLYQKIVANEPQHAFALGYLAIVCYQLEDHTQALKHIDQALALSSEIKFYLYKALIEQKLDNHQQAIALLQMVVEQKPSSLAYNQLGYSFQQIGDYDNGLRCYQYSLQLEPNNPKTLIFLGAYYSRLLDYQQAKEYYEKALAIEPAMLEGWRNLGALYVCMDKSEQALECYQKMLKLEPNNHEALIQIYLRRQSVCDWNQRETEIKNIDRILTAEMTDNKPLSISQFDLLTLPYTSRQQGIFARYCAKQISQRAAKLYLNQQFSFPRNEKERVNIGYLSADFHNHATSHLMLSLFKLHNRKRFNIFTYSYGLDDNSYYRQKIVNDSDYFIDLRQLNDLESAKRIYDDKIDILVDLKGYTRHARLDICAIRPAPIMVTYLGFPGTTGANFFDYVVTDRIVTPENEAQYYSEKFIYMPNCYQVNDYRQKIAELPSKREAGLPEDGFIFCCMNNSYKIDPEVFDCWMQILNAAPNSILWLFKRNNSQIENLRKSAKKYHVDPERLIFADALEKSLHLARLQHADLVLDTLVCGAHTTASDALWAGVPLITYYGDTFARRVAASCLQAIGLAELVVNTQQEYVDLAIKLATTPQLLANIKQRLMNNRTAYPLFDTQTFVQNLEQAYQAIWQRYLQGQPPSAINVKNLTAAALVE